MHKHLEMEEEKMEQKLVSTWMLESKNTTVSKKKIHLASLGKASHKYTCPQS